MDNAEERLLKRRITELEQDVKALKRKLGGLKKRTRKAEQTEAELKDLLEEEEVVTLEQQDFIEEKKPVPSGRCRAEDCRSENVKRIGAGSRVVIVCLDCGSRHTIANQELGDYVNG